MLVWCLFSQVNNFLRWAQSANQRIMRPTSLDRHGRGAALSDFGLQEMLDNLMKDFISPMSTGQLLVSQLDFLVG